MSVGQKMVLNWHDKRISVYADNHLCKMHCIHTYIYFECNTYAQITNCNMYLNMLVSMWVYMHMFKDSLQFIKALNGECACLLCVCVCIYVRVVERKLKWPVFITTLLCVCMCIQYRTPHGEWEEMKIIKFILCQHDRYGIWAYSCLSTVNECMRKTQFKEFPWSLPLCSHTHTHAGRTAWVLTVWM